MNNADESCQIMYFYFASKNTYKNSFPNIYKL
uniref:Uncharacterized protein n=1 Tax=viral metagenome TaxID=1070528 RepID=A0A6C0KJ92_9ZZZZ